MERWIEIDPMITQITPLTEINKGVEEHVEHEHVEHEANLGQKEARLDKEKQSELSNTGERSRRGQPRP